MTTDEYQTLALRTMADQETIRVRRLQNDKSVIQMENGVRGLTDEVGELAGCLKKFLEYGEPLLNLTNMKEEVGDCLWRLAQITDACGFTLEQAMTANITKLKVRYPTKYSDSLAHEDNRDRRMEAAAMSQESLEWSAMDKEFDKRVQDGHGFGHAEELPSGAIPFKPKTV